MISTNGRTILQRFVTDAKNLLMDNVTAQLNQHYGIWEDGTVQPWQRLATRDAGIVYRAKLLRQRLDHIKNNLPETTSNRDRSAVRQLTAEQAFTTLNRFCALRMCEERELIPQTIGGGFDSIGFQSYDMVTGQGRVGSRFSRYTWFLESMFDELSVELPAVFDRYSPYGLVLPDETTMVKLFDLVNSESLTAFYDPGTGDVVNFWKENETLGWIFQYYNSLEERRKIREESIRPRNSREMAIRNQFFTPDYIVRFLTDNSLGRIWYEMTGGKTDIVDICKYMVRRLGEDIPKRDIKEPTELSMLDPACGSMHFGLYTFDVLEGIYMDAWDNQPELLQRYRYELTRDQFRALVPKLILENNIHGVEIDPRALQIAALSLWLRAQQSWSELGIPREDRPMITKSGLVLAEPMPGNKKLLEQLIKNLDKPMQRLVKKVWDVMKHVDEAGMLIRVEHEIEAEIEELRKNWSQVNRTVNADLFSDEAEKARIEAENKVRAELRSNKDAFFAQIKEKLQEALRQISTQLSDEEGYENTLFANDAVRGFAFIEMCQKRYDCILMNPPFGEGSENTVPYLDKNYEDWSHNLVGAFFIRMQELINEDGSVGSIFDRTVIIKSSYEMLRKNNLCGYILNCIDTGWGVLDALVETSTLIFSKKRSDKEGVFIDVRPIENKDQSILSCINSINKGDKPDNVFFKNSSLFHSLPNGVIGYDFNDNILHIFSCPTITQRSMPAQRGMAAFSDVYYRVFYEMPLSSTEFKNLYCGGNFTLFYTPYRNTLKWANNGQIIRASRSFSGNGFDYFGTSGVCYGKRGEIVDTHILKKDLFFTDEGQSVPNLRYEDGLLMNSYINSIVAQFSVNQYTGQHKHVGYMRMLPMPDYEKERSKIELLVKNIIEIKRWWFSFDETNLEYIGFLSRLIPLELEYLKTECNEKYISIENTSNFSISRALDLFQERLTADYVRYTELVKQNDDLWMDLAEIDPKSDFRKTLNEYKSRRPYEELLSIDGASSGNIINKQILAKEIIMELVGMAFGRWSYDYARGKRKLPEFDGIFDPLPFMPKVYPGTQSMLVSYDGLPSKGASSVTLDPSYRPGILGMPFNICQEVQTILRMIFDYPTANDIEYELSKLIGVNSLQDFFENMGPGGFFDYHIKRYTKSRRKAPIYWPISSPEGKYVFWIYYPLLSTQTLPSIILLLSQERTQLNSAIQEARLKNDKSRVAEINTCLAEAESLISSLKGIDSKPFIPQHDDGVPVTASIFAPLFRHREWAKFTSEMWSAIEKGDYDWSHLAYTLFKTRIEKKAKNDWCLALTHGLEEICENKPKPKKSPKKSKTENESNQPNLFD